MARHRVAPFPRNRQILLNIVINTSVQRDLCTYQRTFTHKSNIHDSMKTPQILLLATCLFAGACQNVTKQEPPKDIISVNMEQVTDSLFRYSELFQSVQVIPLDNSGVLVAGIDKMIVGKDLLYIRDNRTESIYAFRKDGSFVRKYGSLGPGPEEYGSCRDFTIDEQGNKLYLYDARRNRIITYNLQTGEFENDLPLEKPLQSNEISYYEGNLYASQAYSHPQTANPCYLLHQIDLRSGRETGTMLDADVYNKEWKGEFLSAGKSFANIDGEIWFCSGLMDSVMTIRQGKAVPAMVMQGKNVVQKADIDKEALSANSSPTDQTRQMMNLFMRLNKEQKQYGFSNFFMHGKDIWFQCFGGSILKVRHNLQDGKTTIYSKTEDDVLFRAGSNVSSVPNYLTADEGGVYYGYNTEQLRELQQLFYKRELSDKVIGTIGILHLNEESNPVVLYYQFKK